MVMTAVVTRVVRCRQLLQRDNPLLMLDGPCALFSQVNNGLRDMFPACAGSALPKAASLVTQRDRAPERGARRNPDQYWFDALSLIHI